MSAQYLVYLIFFAGNHSCNGGYNCEKLNNSTIGDNSCLKDRACSNLKGKRVGTPENDKYTAHHLKSYLHTYSIGSSTIYSGSCNGELSCKSQTGILFVGNASCLGVYSCSDFVSSIPGIFTAGSGSCVGDGR